MVHSEGFEPPTHGLEVRCSIQLSYECIILLNTYGLTIAGREEKGAITKGALKGNLEGITITNSCV